MRTNAKPKATQNCITPGKWTVKADRYVGYCTVWAEGQKIANIMVAGGQGPANARLIAAAPVMLAALEVFAAHFPELETEEPIGGADAVETLCIIWPQMRAAIAKAKGKV